LLNPRSVAVVGASDDPTKISGRPLHFLLRAEFAGPIYAVNPSREQAQGLRCYPSIAELPRTPDLVLIAVPAQAVLDVVRDCAQSGVPVAIVTSAGFGETDEDGRELQRKICAAARHGGVRLLGPNCLGAFNAFTGMYATFSQTLMSGFPTAGPVAVVTQSGAYGSHLAFLSQRRNLNIGFWVTTGNEADITVAEVLEWMVDRPEVQVILVYVEGVRDGAAFRGALTRARSNRKPVIVLKVGRSADGTRMAGSHTGALSGADEVYDAVLRQAGAYRAGSIEEQLDVGYVCARATPRPVRRLGVVTVSGGVGAHICDVAATYGLPLPRLPRPVQRQLHQMVPYASVANPVDCTAAALQDTALTSAAFRALLRDGACDAVVGFFSTVPSNAVFAQRLQEAMISGVAGYPAALLVICMVAGPDTISRYEEAGALVFEDPNRAVRAIAALGRFGESFESALDERPEPIEPLGPLEPRAYSEVEAKTLLAAAGVPVPRELLAHDADEAAAAARLIGLPVALKIVSPDIVHKSDAGGVALALTDIDSVRDAHDSILTAVHRVHPTASVEGVLVSPMAAAGTELIVGAKVDPTFGPVIMVGLGGVFVETFRDVALRPAPVDHSTARAMLSELAGAAVLEGARGREPADLDAIARCVVAVSRFAAGHGENLREVEVNPLVAYPKGQGVLALDAMLVGGTEEITA
jgi:acyl-CoA synthetase (NDP forming)